MGRALTSPTSVSVQTSNYQIGDLADFVGLPAFYDNGVQQWMQTGQWVDGAAPNSVVRATLAKTPALAALTKNALLEAFESVNTFLPPATISGIACIPMLVGAYMWSLTVDATGIGAALIGLPTGQGSGAVTITSDGTKLWAWWPMATTFSAATSTDGKTWTPATLTGQPAYTSPATNLMGPPGGQASINGTGEHFVGPANIALYCGARHLLIGPNGSGNAMACRSTNGLAWGGDESTTILGATNLAMNAALWWYRSGNNVFLSINGTHRYSSDGGINWGTPTGAPPGNPPHIRVNSSDPSRLMHHAGGVNANFSSNYGVSWVARVMPITPTTLYGIGSTWVISDGTVAYRSTDDGATWTLIATPTGMVGTVRGIYADANRFYMHTTGNQVCTSTDASTWTVRNIATPEGTTITLLFCTALDSNYVVFNTGPNSGDPAVLYTTDGGVTFKWAKRSSSTIAGGMYGHAYRAVSAGGTKALISGSVQGVSAKDTQSILLPADLANGGAAFRVTPSAATPIRSGSSSYSRVS